MARVLHDLLSELVTLVELREILLDGFPGLFTVERIGPALGKVDLDLAVRDLVLELGGAPTGAPVELQPVLDADGLGFRVVREDAGVGDRIARADEAVIGVLASRVDLLAADHGGRRGRIALGFSRNFAHVAGLAGDAGFACRAVAILIPDDLQLDSQVDGDLVTADAELRLGDLVVRDHALVDVVAAPVGAGFDGVRFLVGEDVFDYAFFAAAVDRLVDLARLDPALAIDLAVALLDPVAGDAAYALAGNLAARPERRFACLAELCADLLVAAHAEGADRSLGQLLELLLELVEHRRDRRIGMLRGRPLFVNLLMALAALRSGGIEREGFLIDRRDGSFFFACGIGFSGRFFRVGSFLLVPPDKYFERSVSIGWRGRFIVLCDSQPRLGLHDLGSYRTAGPGDSILAENAA